MGLHTYQEFDRPLYAKANCHKGRQDVLRPGFSALLDLDQFVAGRLEETIYVIGGAGLYAQTMHAADELFVTRPGTRSGLQLPEVLSGVPKLIGGSSRYRSFHSP
jgi:dihydrofolate reductase